MSRRPATPRAGPPGRPSVELLAARVAAAEAATAGGGVPVGPAGPFAPRTAVERQAVDLYAIVAGVRAVARLVGRHPSSVSRALARAAAAAAECNTFPAAAPAGQDGPGFVVPATAPAAGLSSAGAARPRPANNAHQVPTMPTHATPAEPTVDRRPGEPAGDALKRHVADLLAGDGAAAPVGLLVRSPHPVLSPAEAATQAQLFAELHARGAVTHPDQVFGWLLSALARELGLED